MDLQMPEGVALYPYNNFNNDQLSNKTEMLKGDKQ